MITINNLVNALRIGIIPLFTIFRCIFCLIKIMYNDDERKVYIRRIVNAVVFFILSQLVFVIKDIIEYYY